MEMTLRDLEDAAKMPDDFPKGRVIKSNNYKTSFLYGAKAVCIAEEIYVHTLIYRDYLRPLLIKDDNLGIPDHERYFILKRNSEKYKADLLCNDLFADLSS